MKKFLEEKKFLLSIIGLVISTGWALTTYFYPSSQNPNLIYYQKNVFDAITLDQPIDNLTLCFNGDDIRKNGLNIKVFTLKMINDGKSAIRENDYSKNIPFGIEVKNGKVIGVKIAKSSYNDENIEKYLNPRMEDSTRAIFDKIVIGKGKSVKFDLVVIHKNKTEPRLEPLGEIADCNIHITSEDEAGDTNWFGLLVLFPGSIIAIVVTLLIGIKIGEGISWLISAIRKRKFLRIYNYPYKSPSDSQIAIAGIYAALKKKIFMDLLNVFTDADETRLKYEKENKIIGTVTAFNQLKKEKKIYSKDKEDITYKSDFLKVLQILKKNNLIEKMDEETIIIKQDFLEEIERTQKLLNI